MLTDSDKARILEEETYRREVRLALTDSRGARWQKFWSIVNSAVFIWLLSSVVLGTASFLYNRREKADAIEDENRRTAKKLDAEITNRLLYFDQLLVMQRMTLQSDSSTQGDYDLSKLLVTALERPSAADYPVNVFPEYLNRSLRSLLWELIEVVPDQDKNDIR